MIAAPPPPAPVVDLAPAPAIDYKPIPYGPRRRQQMAAYSWRHYGARQWRLTNPRAVVLHFTVSSTWQSAWNLFASNTPAPGPAGSRAESPGSCTHFIVHTDGRIIQAAPLGVMCRHAIGINHRAIGIEFVEMSSADNVLHRPVQRRAGLRLVRWLQGRFGIPARDVIGHGMVNDSRWFAERQPGWRNDHTDWNRRQVRQFRAGL